MSIENQEKQYTTKTINTCMNQESTQHNPLHQQLRANVGDNAEGYLNHVKGKSHQANDAKDAAKDAEQEHI
ncbi:hypothetical protein EJB05_10318, partial [Eragrostis curvula]